MRHSLQFSHLFHLSHLSDERQMTTVAIEATFALNSLFLFLTLMTVGERNQLMPLMLCAIGIPGLDRT